MFLCRIQLNHPYTHKRHRFLPARASRRKSAPLVASSETRRPTGFGETIAKIPVNIDRRSCLSESKVLRDNESRSNAARPLFLPDLLRERSRTGERERREKANVPHRKGAQIRAARCPRSIIRVLYAGVPVRLNSSTVRGSASASLSPLLRTVSRKGRYLREIRLRVYTQDNDPGCGRMPLFHVRDTPNRFGRLSIVIDAYTFMTRL